MTLRMRELVKLCPYIMVFHGDSLFLTSLRELVEAHAAVLL